MYFHEDKHYLHVTAVVKVNNIAAAKNRKPIN